MVEIRTLQSSQVEAAKAVMATVCHEFFGQEPMEFEDMDNIEAQYAGAAGLFLVLLDDGKVVGTGAIRRLNDDTGELKRMWFLKEYRSRGYGAQMAERLLQFARNAGYRKVRLDTAANLEQAIKLYKRLGFHPIERYNDGPCTVFMEKTL